MTAFGTPGTDDGTAATGTLAHEEAVGTLAAHNRGLIGAFHNGILPRETRDYIVFGAILSSAFSASPCG
jgi:hypothetical protein